MTENKGNDGNGVSSHLVRERIPFRFDSTSESSQEETSVESQLSAEAIIEGLVAELCYFDDPVPENSTHASPETGNLGGFIRNGYLDDRCASENHEGWVSLEMRVEKGESVLKGDGNENVAILLNFVNDHIDTCERASIKNNHNSCQEKTNILLEKESEGGQPEGLCSQSLKHGGWNMANGQAETSAKETTVEEGIRTALGVRVEKENKGMTISHHDNENEMNAGPISFKAVVPNDGIEVVGKEGTILAKYLVKDRECECGSKDGSQNDGFCEKGAADTHASRSEDSGGKNTIGKEGPYSPCKNEGNKRVLGEVQTCNKSIAASRNSVQNKIRKCFVDAFAQFLTEGEKQKDLELPSNQVQQTKEESTHVLEEVRVVGSINAAKTPKDEISIVEVEEGGKKKKILFQEKSKSKAPSSNLSSLSLENPTWSCGDSPDVSSGLIESAKPFQDAEPGIWGKSICNNPPDSSSSSFAVSSNLNSVAISTNLSAVNSSFSTPAVQQLISSPMSKPPSKTLSYAEIVTKGEGGRGNSSCAKIDVEMEVREMLVKQLKDLAAAFMSAENNEVNTNGEKKESTGEWGFSEESEKESDATRVSKGSQTIEKGKGLDNDDKGAQGTGLETGSQQEECDMLSEGRGTSRTPEKGGEGHAEMCFEEEGMEWGESEGKEQRQFEWGESEGSSVAPDDVTDVPSELSLVGNFVNQDVGVQVEEVGMNAVTVTEKTSDAGVPTVTVSTQTPPLPQTRPWLNQKEDGARFGASPALGVPLFQSSTLSHWPTYCGLFLGGLPFKQVPFCEKNADRWAGNREVQEQQLKFAKKCQWIMREEYLERLRAGKAWFY